MSVTPNGLPWAKSWQKSSVVYQIYPSSFMDTTGSGSGDLNGIESKLDYLRALGADVLWLSPIYPSPNADMGYDISDYEDIDPAYGSLADWDRLVAGVHKRGMKLIMDLVVNHTSDEHAWFRESRSSKSNPKRDWYMWRPAKYDEQGNRMPPNNWRSIFQGSAWEWDEGSQEYYLHLFLDKQPDLNWENPAVRRAVFDMMKRWLDRGCDGFRMDVINLISKVPELPDAPVDDSSQPWQWAAEFFANGPRVHEYIREMNRDVLAPHDVFTVGEAPFSFSAADLAEYVLPANHELDMVFQFEFIKIDQVESSQLEPREWTLPEMKAIVARWQTFKRNEGFWNSIYIQNHDQSWALSRFGDASSQWRAPSGKLLCLLEICQGGTLFVYQGEELGMINSPREWGIEEYKDQATINYYQKVLNQRKAKAAAGTDVDMTDVMDGIAKKARDHSRRPMQWSADKHAGFTTGTPWMRVNTDYETWNAAAEEADPTSVLHFWRAALKFRAAHDVLIYGDFTLLAPEHEQIFAFTRTVGESEVALVVLNFSKLDISFDASEAQHLHGKVKLAFSNYAITDAELGKTVNLKGYEGRVYLLESLTVTSSYLPGFVR